MNWEVLTSVLVEHVPDRDMRREIYRTIIHDGAYVMHEEDYEDACEIDVVFARLVEELIEDDELEYDDED